MSCSVRGASFHHTFKWFKIETIIFSISDTAWKMSKYGVFPGPNTGKYGPEKTQYLEPFHVVWTFKVYI